MAFDTDAVSVAIFKACGVELPPPPTLPSYVAPDAAAVERLLLGLKEEVEVAMGRGLLPGYGHVFAPYLDTLQGLVVDGWGRLGEQSTFDDILAWLAELAELDSGAAILGYGFFVKALVATHNTERSKVPARRQMVLMQQYQREGHGHADDAGHTDDGGPVPVSPGGSPPEGMGGPWGAAPAAADADTLEAAYAPEYAAG